MASSQIYGKILDSGNDYATFDQLVQGCDVVVKAMVCRKWDAHNSFGKYLSTEFILSDAQSLYSGYLFFVVLADIQISPLSLRRPSFSQTGFGPPRFMITPDMLKNDPMFKSLDARIKGKGTALGVGRGRADARKMSQSGISPLFSNPPAAPTRKTEISSLHKWRQNSHLVASVNPRCLYQLSGSCASQISPSITRSLASASGSENSGKNQNQTKKRSYQL